MTHQRPHIRRSKKGRMFRAGKLLTHGERKRSIRNLRKKSNLSKCPACGTGLVVGGYKKNTYLQCPKCIQYSKGGEFQ